MKRNAATVYLPALLLCAAAASARASGPPAQALEAGRHQGQQLGAYQARALAQPDVLSPSPAGADAPPQLPDESPCFPIHRIDWHGIEELPWLARPAPLAGACVGAQGLALYRRWLTRRLVARGYVTSQVALPEQDLASGRLRVEVIAGRLGEIRSSAPALGWTRPLFPQGRGALLNLRDLDQALENLRRLPGQASATFDLLPGAALGETDVLLRPPAAARRATGLLSLDNAGQHATGRHQLGAVLAVDSPLGLHDQLLLSYSSEAARRDRGRASRAASAAWNVAAGYARFSLGASEWSHAQPLLHGLGGAPLPLHGRTRRIDAGLDYVLHRDGWRKASVFARLARRQDRSWVGGSELQQWKRDLGSYELGAAFRQRRGSALWSASLSLRGGLPGLSAHPGTLYGQDAWNGRYQLFNARLSADAEGRLAGLRLRYQGTLLRQHAPVPVPPTEYLQIGGRYTVRGFDGNATLAGPGGWIWRNEISLPWAAHAEPYVALDAGQAAPAPGGRGAKRWLAGTALGLRGQIQGRARTLGYDLALGLPLVQPEHFPQRSASIDFSLSTCF